MVGKNTAKKSNKARRLVHYACIYAQVTVSDVMTLDITKVGLAFVYIYIYKYIYVITYIYIYI